MQATKLKPRSWLCCATAWISSNFLACMRPLCRPERGRQRGMASGPGLKARDRRCAGRPRPDYLVRRPDYRSECRRPAAVSPNALWIKWANPHQSLCCMRIPQREQRLEAPECQSGRAGYKPSNTMHQFTATKGLRILTGRFCPVTPVIPVAICVFGVAST